MLRDFIRNRHWLSSNAFSGSIDFHLLISSFLNVEASLYSWDKPYFVVIYTFFYIARFNTLMFQLRFFSSIYKWGGCKFSFVCMLSELSQLQAHSSILWFVMLGLEPHKPHFCFANWFLLSLWLTKARRGRRDLLLPDSLLWSSCLLPFPVCSILATLLHPARAVSSHINSWIQFVVFLTLAEPASVSTTPLHPHHSDTPAQVWQQPLFRGPSFRSWGPFSILLYFNTFNFLSLFLHTLVCKLLSAAATILIP